jgi:hypothetical protein
MLIQIDKEYYNRIIKLLSSEFTKESKYFGCYFYIGDFLIAHKKKEFCSDDTYYEIFYTTPCLLNKHTKESLTKAIHLFIDKNIIEVSNDHEEQKCTWSQDVKCTTCGQLVRD